MRTGFCRTTLGLIVAGLVGINGSVLHAQTFPSRPVKAITDVGTGGTYDIFVRALGEELQQRWGQGFVVEPHPGGNAIIGNRACADVSSGWLRPLHPFQSGARSKRISLQEASLFARLLQPDHEPVLQHAGHRCERIAQRQKPGRTGRAREGKAGDTELCRAWHLPALVLRPLQQEAWHRSGRHSVQGRRRRSHGHSVWSHA